MSNNNRLVNPKAKNAMEHLKYEVAHDLELDDDIQERGWENMTTKEVGKIGGNMVKRMVAMAEEQLANQENAQK